MNALTAYSVMRKVSMYDIMLSTSSILYMQYVCLSVADLEDGRLLALQRDSN